MHSTLQNSTLCYQPLCQPWCLQFFKNKNINQTDVDLIIMLLWASSLHSWARNESRSFIIIILLWASSLHSWARNESRSFIIIIILLWASSLHSWARNESRSFIKGGPGIHFCSPTLCSSRCIPLCSKSNIKSLATRSSIALVGMLSPCSITWLSDRWISTLVLSLEPYNQHTDFSLRSSWFEDIASKIITLLRLVAHPVFTSCLHLLNLTIAGSCFNV